MKQSNQRFYKGDICRKCGKAITDRNKSGFCRSHRKFPKSVCKKISISLMAEKNPMWKGDKAKYHALHRWIEIRLKKPRTCEICKKAKPHDLANKGVYDRILTNWNWLCRRCHMLSDGRMKNLIQYHS